MSRFSALFVFVLLANIGMSWLAVKMKSGREQRAVVEGISKLGGSAKYDYMLTWYGGETGFTGPSWRGGLVNPYAVDQNGNPDNPKPGIVVPTWLRSLLSDDFFAEIYEVSLDGEQVTDAQLEQIKRLPKLQWLYLCDTGVTDAGLEHIKDLTQLEELWLNGAKVTGTGLKHLRGLSKLNFLNLHNTCVTDAGLKHLKGWTHLGVLILNGTNVTDAGLEDIKDLTSLGSLGLSSTKITDAGLQHLKGLTKLGVLWLENTAVTRAGVEKLQQALPSCHIVDSLPYTKPPSKPRL